LKVEERISESPEELYKSHISAGRKERVIEIDGEVVTNDYQYTSSIANPKYSSHKNSRAEIEFHNDFQILEEKESDFTDRNNTHTGPKLSDEYNEND